MPDNKNANAAKKARKNEFYTQLDDITNELRHYSRHFKDKVVYCNCDDPRVSNFFQYFSARFEELGLKKLITTCYRNQNVDLFSEGRKGEPGLVLEYEGDQDGDFRADLHEIEIKQLSGDGCFKSEECVALLKQVDIVCTNPPFSRFREYFQQIMGHGKDFLIIGNQNALTYTHIFQHIRGGGTPYHLCKSKTGKFD